MIQQKGFVIKPGFSVNIEKRKTSLPNFTEKEERIHVGYFV